MELLILLVRRQGELVTREEIANQLWGKDVFVDTDHSINTAVRKVRAALRDDPAKPRFIETVVGKGYRFAAPIIDKGGAPPPTEPREQPAAVEIPVAIKPRRLTGTRIALALVILVASACALFWASRSDYFWRTPLAHARFQSITDFDGVGPDAAISRDGNFIAFLSDRDGKVDLWVTQVGSGEFHNLTRGRMQELVNPSVRTLGFSPDGSLVTFWVRNPTGSDPGHISVWAVPTFGGEPRPYLDGAAEFAWSHDGSHLAYHTAAPGDPLFLSDGTTSKGKLIFTAPVGQHSHFPVWSWDGKFIYFVQGMLPDKLDIWRLPAAGGAPERITTRNGSVSHPTLLDDHTLLYLATEPDGSGPWLYSMDLRSRVSHRLSSELERFTSLASSADGHRLVLTAADSKPTLWRLPLANLPATTAAAHRVSLSTSTGSSPRMGPDYLIYLSREASGDSIWKLASGTSTELWKGEGAQIFGGPSISRDGRSIAFSARQHGNTVLFSMQADGTNARAITDSFKLQGDPAWSPDGKSIISAVNDSGTPHLFRIGLDGVAQPLVQQYSVDPAWAPGADFLVYSGPDVGASFALNAVTSTGGQHPLPPLSLTRGERHIAFLPDGGGIVCLRGDLRHKNLWLIDLKTGAEKQLTDFTPDFEIRDFDLSPDGREVVLERVEQRSNVLLVERPR